MNTYSPRTPDFADELDIDDMICEALALAPRIQAIANGLRISFDAADLPLPAVVAVIPAR